MNDFGFIHIRQTDSTNSYLKELARAQQLPQGFTVYADYQTAGRGQKGNSWESESEANLLFSTILFPERLEAAHQFIVSQLISLAIKDVLDAETSGITIKWPNDIYWQERKIAGILIENDIMDGMLSQSVVGAGINLNQKTFGDNAPNPVSLAQITAKSYDTRSFLKKILNRIEYYAGLLRNEREVEKIRVRYKECLFRKEGFHTFADEQGTFDAEILDIEKSGMLILRKVSGETGRYAFKQVRFVL